MIAAPLPHVRVHDAARRRSPKRGLPRHAIPIDHADLQIGGILDELPGVDVVALVHPADHSRSTGRVGDRQQLRRQFVDDLFVVGLLDGALTLAAFQVDEHLAKPHRIRLGARPIHVLPERAAAQEQVAQVLLLGPLPLDRQVALVHQPRVEIDRLSKRMESVVRHDDDLRVGTDSLDDLAHHLVHALVDAQDRVAVLGGGLGVVHRMRLVLESPHHMADAVGGFDDADEQIPPARVEAVHDDLRAIVEGAEQIVHEGLLVDPIFVERPRRFSPAERAEVPKPVVEVLRERGGRRNRDGWVVRPPVDWRDVQTQILVRAHYVHLHHALQAHQIVDAEIEHHPLAPLAFGKTDGVALDLDGGFALRPIPPDRHRDSDILACRQLGKLRLVAIGDTRALRLDLALLSLDDRILRADELGACLVLIEHEPFQDAAHLGVAFFVPRQVGREVVERANRASNIRQRQPRQQFAVLDVLRGKRDRHRQQARPHAGPAGGDPERRAAADRLNLRLLDRDVVEQELGGHLLDDAQIGHVGFRVAHEEVEDIVLARVHAGRKRRPRHRRFRRMSCAERGEGALRGKLREIREPALRHPALRQNRVHAVVAKDHHLLFELLGRGGASAIDRAECDRAGKNNGSG